MPLCSASREPSGVSRWPWTATAGMFFCRPLQTPVTGGNVSFYNETMGQAIFPTPIVGMLGILAHIDHATTPGWKGAGDVVVLLGQTRGELGGRGYIKVYHGLMQGR